MSNEDTNNQNVKAETAGPTIEHDANEVAPKRRFSTTFLVGAGIAGAIIVAAGAAIAQGGMGHGMGGMGHWGGKFAEHRFERMMDEIDATDAQQDKIWAIVDKTRSDLRPVGRDFRDSREKVAELLAAPTIDKAAVEALRVERIAAIDVASKKAVDALVEAAEVLTPEQRTELAKEIKERGERGWMGGDHRGGPRDGNQPQ
jgi:protein CpxP